MNRLLTAFLALAIVQAGMAQTKDGNTEPNQKGGSGIVAGKDASCGCELALPEVLAVINGKKITLSEINAAEAGLVAEVADLQQAVTEARRRELDLQINSILLAAEAKRRKITTVELLEAEVSRKIEPVSVADAKAFYDVNKDKIGGEFDAVKDDIALFLRTERGREEAAKFAARLRAAVNVRMFADSAVPASSEADRGRIVAEVGEAKITAGSIEDSLTLMIRETRQRIFALYSAALDRRINDVLLEDEAAKRKLTGQELLEAEVAGKTGKISDADALAFYNQNKDRIDGEFSAVKGALVAHLKGLAENEATIAFAGRLRSASDVRIFLVSPAPANDRSSASTH